MKKVLVCVLILMLITSAVTVGAAAEEMPTITVSSGEAAPGQEVSVAVSIENNPGIMAFVLGIDYDSEVLERVSVTHEGLTGSWIVGENAVWIGAADSDYDGRIMTVTFRVKDDAPTGSSAVTIRCEDGAVANSDEQTVDFSVIPGSVNVTGAGQPDSGEKTPAETSKPTAAPGQTGGGTGTQTASPVTTDEEDLEQSVLETLTEMTDGQGPISIEDEPTADPDGEAETDTVTEPAPSPEIVSGIGGENAETQRGADRVLVVILVLSAVLVGLTAATVVTVIKRKKRAPAHDHRHRADRR